MFKSILTAAIISVGIASAAFTLPSAPSTSPVASASTDVLLVKQGKGYKKGHKGHAARHANRQHKRYAAAHKYRYAPKNWHRYSYRPLAWQVRGCVVVGVIWYCP